MRPLLHAVYSFLKDSFTFHGKGIQWINFARGITIIMVVYRHSFEGIRNSGMDISAYDFLELLNNMMYTFRMPLFFLISGFLMTISLQKLGLWKYIRKRAEIILYPYVIWASIQITLQILFPQFVNGKSDLYTYLYILYDPRKLEQFWYLYALFNIMLVYSLTKVKLGLSPGLQFIIGIAMFFAAQYCHNNNIHLYFVSDIFYHYIFFATGDLVSSFLMKPANRKLLTSWALFAISLPVFVLLHLYYLADESSRTKPVVLLIAFSGIIFALSVSFLLEKYERLNWLKVLGANSLYIYLLHVMIMAANRAFMVRVLGIESVPFLLYTNIFIGLTVPIVAYNLLLKMGCWWLFSPRKPRKAPIMQPSFSS